MQLLPFIIMSSPRPSFLAIFIVLIAACPALGADSTLKIDDAWVRAVPSSLSDTAAFMHIVNSGDTPLRLTGAETPLAAMAMPMATTHKTVNGVEVLGMKSVDFIEIPAHGEATLKPGGDHLMLMTLSAHPHPGDTIPITLQFEPGHQKITIQLTARIDG
jgi:copper(I)-binding protein